MIFDRLSIDRSAVRWEDWLDVDTPCQQVDGQWWKRDDLWAPLGPGTPDGLKVRNLVWLAERFVRAGGRRVLTGGSVLSPAIARVALVARHFDLDVTVVYGGTTLDAAMRHTNPAIAAMCGATFEVGPVGYNPAIQKRLRELADADPGAWKVEYGVGMPDSTGDADLVEFYTLTARQCATVPPDVEHLVMPAGSMNAAVGVWLGLAATPTPVRTVDFIGVGPSRIDWFYDRARRVTAAAGLPWPTAEVRFHDLHGDGWTTYAKRCPERVGDLELHPTYEGKCYRYLRTYPDRFPEWWRRDGRSLFWIVGGESTVGAVERALYT